MKCIYGCGKTAIKQMKNGNWICSQFPTQCEANRKKNSNGLIQAHKNGKVPGWNQLAEKNLLNRGWSSRLTKEIDTRVKKSAETRRKKIKSGEIIPGFLGKKHSTKTKKHLSKKRIKYLENNNKHCNWHTINEIKVQGNLEKSFAEFLCAHDIQFERKRIKYQIHRTYTPDFYLPQYDIFVEVKGFLYEKDKVKMLAVLSENQIDLRLAYKQQIDNLITIDNIMTLPKVKELISLSDIDFYKFNNHWGR